MLGSGAPLASPLRFVFNLVGRGGRREEITRHVASHVAGLLVVYLTPSSQGNKSTVLAGQARDCLCSVIAKESDCCTCDAD